MPFGAACFLWPTARSEGREGLLLAGGRAGRAAVHGRNGVWLGDQTEGPWELSGRREAEGVSPPEAQTPCLTPKRWPLPASS